MLSIIKKEIREGYLPLAISIVIFMLVMSYFKVHDMANIIVFLFWAPGYVLLISQGVFVRERNQDTSKFLFSLPMSKKSLYLGKMIGSLITGLLIYLTFYILMTIMGLGGTTNYYEVVGIELKPIFVYLVLPLGAWVIGAAAGLLHTIVSATLEIMMVVILASPFIYYSPGIHIMNPMWIIFIVLFFGIVVSYKLFQNTYEQSQWGLAFQSIKYFSISVFSICALLFTLGHLGELGSKSWNSIFEIESRYIVRGNKFLVNIGRKTNMFDLIPGSTNDMRLLDDNCIVKEPTTGLYKFNKQNIKQIYVGNRYTYPSNVCSSDDGQDLLYRSNYSWLLTDARALYSLNISTKKTILVSHEAYPIAYTSNGNILFYTYNNERTGKVATYRYGWNKKDTRISVQLYDKLTHSSKEICVVDTSTHFVRTGSKIIADTGTLPVIDLNTLEITSLRKQLKLAKGVHVSRIKGSESFATIILRKRVNNREFKDDAILQYTNKGEIIKTQINPEGQSNTEFDYVDGSKDGYLCYLFERDYLDKSATLEKLFIAKKDQEPVLIAEHLHIPDNAVFSKSGKYLCFQYKDNQEDHMTTVIINVKNKKIVFSTKDNYAYCYHIKPFKDDSFIAESGADIIYFDHDTNDKVVKLFNLKDEFNK